MDKLLSIFLGIEKTPDISQRQLAKTTGYSLGTVNGILQKLVDDGDLYLDNIAPNHFQYVITAKGQQHKGKLMYDFALDGYEIIGKIKAQTKAAIEISIKEGCFMFLLLGPNDPIKKLVKMSMIEIKRQYAIDYKELDQWENRPEEGLYKVLTWDKNLLEISHSNLLHVLLV